MVYPEMEISHIQDTELQEKERKEKTSPFFLHLLKMLRASSLACALCFSRNITSIIKPQLQGKDREYGSHCELRSDVVCSCVEK